jgi:hypothetical protein
MGLIKVIPEELQKINAKYAEKATDLSLPVTERLRYLLLSNQLEPACKLALESLSMGFSP